MNFKLFSGTFGSCEKSRARKFQLFLRVPDARKSTSKFKIKYK